MRIGLTWKLLLAIGVVLALMAGGMVVAVHRVFEPDLSQYLRRVEVEQIRPLAELLGRSYEQHGNWDFLDRRRWREMLTEVIDRHAPPADPSRPSGDVIGMLPRLSLIDMEGMPIVRTPLPPSPVHEPDWMELPVEADGEMVAILRMLPTPVPVAGLDQQFRADRLHAFYLAALPGLLLALLAALALGYHFLQPLRRLARGIHALANGDYAVRLDTSRGDELGRLSDDFNHLADVLERTEAQRREGMAGVSHELRTPLATLMAEVDAMIDGIRPLNGEQLHSLSGTIEHLSRLVDDLYQLALADVDALVFQRLPVAWNEVVEEALEAAHAKLAARQLRVERRIEPLIVDGDAHRLRQIVDNLLENCRRYTESGGTLTLELRRQGDDAVLTLADSGPGVDDATLAAMFDRFYRADISRSRDSGGAGLGLSLVKAIAQAHGGSVAAFHAPQGGLGMRVTLPLRHEDRRGPGHSA